MTAARSDALAGIRCVSTDYGHCIDNRRRPRDQYGNHPVDLSCAAALRLLGRYGLVLILSTNTRPGQHRRAALAAAGISALFSATLASDCIGLAKPDRAFYRLIPAIADCAPDQVLHVGDSLLIDVLGAERCGLQTALIRPAGLAPGEHAMLPPSTLVIRHITELVDLARPALPSRPAPGRECGRNLINDETSGVTS